MFTSGLGFPLSSCQAMQVILRCFCSLLMNGWNYCLSRICMVNTYIYVSKIATTLLTQVQTNIIYFLPHKDIFTNIHMNKQLLLLAKANYDKDLAVDKKTIVEKPLKRFYKWWSLLMVSCFGLDVCSLLMVSTYALLRWPRHNKVIYDQSNSRQPEYKLDQISSSSTII